MGARGPPPPAARGQLSGAREAPLPASGPPGGSPGGARPPGSQGAGRSSAVAGFPAVGRGAPRSIRAEGTARSGCRGLRRAGRTRGRRPRYVGGSPRRRPAVLGLEDRSRSCGPPGNPGRRGWELRPALGRGHRPKVTEPEPCAPQRPGAPHKPRRGLSCRRDADLAQKQGPTQPAQEG